MACTYVPSISNQNVYLDYVFGIENYKNYLMGYIETFRISKYFFMLKYINNELKHLLMTYTYLFTHIDNERISDTSYFCSYIWGADVEKLTKDENSSPGHWILFKFFL